MAINNISQLEPAVREYYSRVLLMTAYPMLSHQKFAMHKMLPEKSGDEIVFGRFPVLDTATVPLDDGITPPGALLDREKIKAKIAFYGNFILFTNQVELTVEDRVLNESSRLLAQNMGQTLDELTRDVLKSTSSVLACENGSNGYTPSNLSKPDLEIVIKTLLTNNALMISEVIPGGSGYGTLPVRPSFFGIIDTRLLDDLENVSGFKNTSSYPDQNPVLDAEWGATGNIRWIYTSIGSKSAATPTVYDNFILAKEAYACVRLGSKSGNFYVEPFGSAGSSDPLHQRGSVGWEIPFVARILNDNFMVNLQATHSV